MRTRLRIVVESTIQRTGLVDYLVNSAGIAEDMRPSSFTGACFVID